jgi:hypothetical protein
LSALESTELLEVWSDQLIEPGAAWEQEIYTHLDQADVVLLLVSAYFYQSEFCFSKELKRALGRHANGDVKVIPVRIRPVTLTPPLDALQALPAGKPVTSFEDPHEAWAAVAGHVYELAQAYRRP